MSGIDPRLAVASVDVDLAGRRVGLVIVDAGVAFTRQGALSDPERMVPMVRRIDAEARALRETLGEKLGALCFLDTHHADIPEPPYPTHGVIGTGEELMDPELRWLEAEPWVSIVRKDCINGFVGAIDRETGRNAFVDWCLERGVQDLVVTGDCTDICVLDFVVSALSARNHGLLTAPGQDRAATAAAITDLRVIVQEPACQTFDAPGFHDRDLGHAVGLSGMAARDEVIARAWSA